MSKPRPRRAVLRPAVFSTVLGFGGAFVAQGERLPLVAVVCAAVGLASLLGLTSEPPMGYLHAWTRGVWYVGDTVTIKTVVSNRGERSSSARTLMAGCPGLQLPPIAVPQLQPGEQIAVVQKVLLTARMAPTGLVNTTVVQHRLVGESVPRVIPATAPRLLPTVRPRPVPPPAPLVDAMSHPSDEGHGTGRRGNADPLALRQFASGDPVSSVHWRSTARAGVPVVMEREQLASGVLVLLVATSVPGDSWEAAICRAAGLVQAAGQIGVPVQVVCAEPAIAPVGTPTHDQVLDWLAALAVVGPAQPHLVERAVRVASGGLVAVLSREPWLAAAVVEAGAAPTSVADLAAASW